MSETDRTQWLAVLNAVSQLKPDQCNTEWEWLLQQLGLGPEYFLAIQQALQQGRWRNAKNPRAYIKTVAKREAKKMEMLSKRNDELVLTGSITEGEGLSSDQILDFIAYQQDSAESVKGPDGVWRAGGGWDREDLDPRREYGSYRDFLLAAVPREFTVIESPSEELKTLIDEINDSTDEFHIHIMPRRNTDWAKWAQAAGFNEWGKKVLDYKLAGISRERALEKQPDEVARKALQAAWKRFDRGGMERLRAAAKKNPSDDVPE